METIVVLLKKGKFCESLLEEIIKLQLPIYLETSVE